MNVRILGRAEADLKRIEEHIEIDDPAAARTTIRRIRKRCLDLADFPHQGRPAGGLERFKKQGRGHPTHINAVPRSCMEARRTKT